MRACVLCVCVGVCVCVRMCVCVCACVCVQVVIQATPTTEHMTFPHRNSYLIYASRSATASMNRAGQNLSQPLIATGSSPTVSIQGSSKRSSVSTDLAYSHGSMQATSTNCKFPKHPFGKKKVVSSVLECFLTAWKFPGFVQTLKYSHLLHSLSMLPAWWMKFKLESNMLLSGRRQTTSLGLLWSPHNARTAVWI